MIKVSVLYPQQTGKKFNMDYYLKTHMPLVRKTFGSLLKGASVERGVSGGAPGTPPVYSVMTHLSFDSMDATTKAMGQVAPLMADIPNFTDIQPAVQIGEVVG